MKKALLISLILSVATIGFAQQGIGVRLGDPSGFTYKKYNGDNALEISFGRTHTFTNNKYYGFRFDKWYADAALGYTNYVYTDTKHSVPLGLQVHYLIHTDWFAAEFPGLQWYYGFGGQFRHQSMKYTYSYKVAGDNTWYLGEADKITDIDLGVDAVIGAEYEFQEAPIRVFIDLTMFVEIVDDPFHFYWPTALGARYMF